MAENGIGHLEKQLWAAADQLWANSPLKPSEYSSPVLGLIFLRFADFKFGLVEKELAGKGTGRRTISKTDYHSRGVLYLAKDARFSTIDPHSLALVGPRLPLFCFHLHFVLCPSPNPPDSLPKHSGGFPF